MDPIATAHPADTGRQLMADLLQHLSSAEIERLTIDAIVTHRRLVDEAERLYQSLPDDLLSEPTHELYFAYVKASLDMHAQVGVVDMLITNLGFIPNVNVN